MAFSGFGKNSGPTAPPKAQSPFGHFPCPSSSPPPTPPSSGSSARPLSPSPRTFDAFERAPSSVGHARPATAPFRSYAAPIRASSLQWGEGQSSGTRDRGGRISKRSSPTGPYDFATSISSNVSHFQDLERTRSPPIQYSEDFLREPDSDVMEGNADVASNLHGHVAKQTRHSPSSAVPGNHSIMTTPPSWGKSQRPAMVSRTWGVPARSGGCNTSLLNERSLSSAKIVDARQLKELSSNDETQRSSYVFKDASRRPSSPPMSSNQTGFLGTPNLQHKQRSPPYSDEMNADTNVTKLVNPSVPKRTRSPPAGQIIQMNSFSAEDDTERELQAKAKRLARFKAELDEIGTSDSIQSGPNVVKKRISSMKVDQSSLEKKKVNRDYPSGLMDNLSQDFDNEDIKSCNVIVGLCPDMCPESERAERERKGDLDHYERLDGDRNQTSKTLAVKKYNRTAEREAELIRPMPILQKTMDYLLDLLDQPYDDRFLGLYNFLWDRMRAIRMDLRMQHIFDLGAINMLEQMIRLHIIAMHELCEFSRGEGFSEGFDAHLNIEQMNKTSVELFQMYDDHRKRGVFIPTEKEFRGYYALLKLDKHPGYKVEPAELSLDLAKMTPEIRQTQEVLLARDVARSCRTGNFIAFFRHARKASYLQACLMHAHFSKLRTQALASLHSGLQYNQGLPVAQVTKWLGMEGEDIESLLEYHGFLIKEFEEPYMVKDGPFLNDEKDYPTRCSRLVHRKKNSTIVKDVLSSHQMMSLLSESEKELQLDKSNKNKHGAARPIRAQNPFSVSDYGAVGVTAVSSPRGSMQIQPIPEISKSVPVQPNFEISRTGKLSMDSHINASAGSPKSNMKVPKAFSSLSSRSMPEQPSPVTRKESSPVMNDGQFNYKTPPWNFSVPQFVPDAQPSPFGWAQEAISAEPARSPPEIAVFPNIKALQSDVSVNVGNRTSPASKVDSRSTSSLLQDDVIMEEVRRKESLDLQQVENNDVANNYDEEVAEAKLKLLLRLWRRWSARKRELREQNRLAGNAALSSLCLGLPIQRHKDKPMPCQKLDIDQALSERFRKYQQSWARWNVSDLLAGKLGEKNANSSCICWKVSSCSWRHLESSDLKARKPVTHLSLEEWLHHKLIPPQNDEIVDDVVMSAPGLSIWRKWVPNHSGRTTCCLSVIKDTECGKFDEKLAGTSGVIFPISEIVPWELQRVQLHNLVRSLATGACIPLLILSGMDDDKLSCSIVDRLGLKDIDKSRVGSFLVIYLNERQDMGRFDGYFSDQKLKEGLMWLASESRPQPNLYHVTIRELVSSHLTLCLNSLDLTGSDKVGPNQCISAFNEAVNRSISDIITAANTNPMGWPCPELFLLDNSTAEYRAVKEYLPCPEWSSYQAVEPLISALRNCKLPPFADDTSWLTKECSTGNDIEDQTQLLHDCLVRYLTQSSNIMNLTMAAKEASVMLQKCTRLELHNTKYRLVPSWLLIFRRVFNWQLNTVASMKFKGYVLEQPWFASRLALLEKEEFEVSISHYIAQPSLDEMIEMSWSPVVSKRGSASPRSFQPGNAADVIKPGGKQCSEIRDRPVDDSDVFRHNNELQLVPQAEKKADRLSQLLDQCNILQDEIERKLCIYF